MIRWPRRWSWPCSRIGGSETVELQTNPTEPQPGQVKLVVFVKCNPRTWLSSWQVNMPVRGSRTSLDVRGALISQGNRVLFEQGGQYGAQVVKIPGGLEASVSTQEQDAIAL